MGYKRSSDLYDSLRGFWQRAWRRFLLQSNVPNSATQRNQRRIALVITFARLTKLSLWGADSKCPAPQTPRNQHSHTPRPPSTFGCSFRLKFLFSSLPRVFSRAELQLDSCTKATNPTSRLPPRRDRSASSRRRSARGTHSPCSGSTRRARRRCWSR